jgi:hypothetical protein
MQEVSKREKRGGFEVFGSEVSKWDGSEQVGAGRDGAGRLGNLPHAAQ